MKIYLAIPYSGIEEESFAVANKITAHLMYQGHVVFSPISQNHMIAKEHGLPTSWEYWAPFDESFIEWCDCLMIVVMNNNGEERIEKSIGVNDEIRLANENDKIIDFIRESDLNC